MSGQSAHENKPLKNVLVIQSYSHGFSWSVNIDRGIRQGLLNAPDFSFEIEHEYLNSNRSIDPEYLGLLKEIMTHRYASDRPDLLIVCDDVALRFILNYRPSVFDSIPMVFCGINEYDPAVLNSGLNITGVLQNEDLAETLKLALGIHRNARKVAVISDQTLTGRALEQTARDQFAGFGKRVEFEYLSDLTWDNLLRQLSEIDKDCIVFYLLFTRDANGRSFLFQNSVPAMSRISPVPIYSHLETLVGLGVVGGYVVSGEDQGMAAADMALRIFRGVEPAQIPIQTNTIHSYQFDYDQLKRFEIEQMTLPAMAQIENRPESFISKNRGLALTALIIIIFLLLVVMILVNTIISRRKADRALRESEERLNLSLDATSDGVWDWNVRTDNVYRSRSWYHMLGYGMSEMEDSFEAIWELIHPDDRPELRAQIEAHFENDNSSFRNEFRMRKSSGEYIWVLGRGKVVKRDKDGKPLRMVGTFADITDRKKMEKELLDSEETYRNLFHNAQVGLFRTRISDGKILECNDQLARMFGFDDRREAIQKYMTSGNYVDPGARKMMLDILSKYGEVKNFEAEFRTKDGSTVWIKYSARIYASKGWIEGVAEDITDQKSMEHKLRKSERRFKDLANLLPQTVFEIDAEGRFTFVNSSGLEFSGYNADDIKKGVSIFDVLKVDDIDRVRRNFRASMQGQPPTNSEYKLQKKNGSIAIVSIYASPILQDGTVVGLRGIVIDLTEKKRLQEFAARAQRLETAGRIAGQVAHDFNNLLGPLVAYPDLIMDELPRDNPAFKFIDDMKKAAEQISEINQELLTLGRRGHYNQEPVNLNEIVEQVLSRISPCPDSLVIEKELSPDLMNVMGGSSQILRSIYNLVGNARDAMQDIGTLTVKTKNFYVDEETYRYGRVPRGEYVKLTISDTGTGIDPDHLSRIFDPFFTTKKAERKKGTGLGLSVVHAVMEDHNGHIDCESKPGEGTSMYLYFPISRDAIKGEDISQISGGSESILVVDDDATQRDVTRLLLEKLGYKTATAESGEEAIEILKERRFDLLILDMVMPGGTDGTETYKHALEINSSQRALIVSGFAESERVAEAQELGVGAFLKKPLTLKLVAAAVRRELDKVTQLS